MQSTDLQTTRQLAEQGDVKAQLALGKLFLAQERYDDAASWLHKAAEQEDGEAECIYGSLLFEGLGVNQDYEAANFWFRRSAEKDHSGAQVLLAQNFESGSGVPVNRMVAAQWYLRAAELGDKIAQLRYGQLLRTGSGVEQDLQEALKWLRLAVEAGCAEAEIEIVECLIEMPVLNIEEVILFSRSAAEKGHARGQYLLGWAFETSAEGASGTEQSTKWDEAIKWYREAADQGLTDAQIRLGKLYADGKIVAKDQVEAEKWLSMAVADGKAEQSPEITESARFASIAPFMSINEYPPGSVIDNKYFIMSILGKGGMCMVYKAKHLLMNKMVAIKMLLPESAANAGLVERFRREAQAASSLSHPNIINIFDLGISPDNKPFMVMDYLEGKSLEQRIESGQPVSFEEFLPIMIQVCAAVEAAHESNIIHRDIKPSNVMLVETKTQTNFVKVVDFGLAKILDDGESHKLTKTGEVFGTLMYMSPEQCLGHPLDLRTDIYSVGCLMYETITGTPVHRGASAFELMSKHVHLPPTAIAEAAPHVKCPPELEPIILKALAKNREDRYQTITELHQALSNMPRS